MTMSEFSRKSKPSERCCPAARLLADPDVAAAVTSAVADEEELLAAVAEEEAPLFKFPLPLLQLPADVLATFPPALDGGDEETPPGKHNKQN